MDGILNNLLVTAGVLFIGLPVLYLVSAYLYNKKFLPYEASKGRARKKLGQLIKEVTRFSFKEDRSPLRLIHIILVLGGVLASILFHPLALLVLPLSFLIGVGRTLPVLSKREKVLERFYNLSASHLRLTTSRSKNAPPPIPSNHIQVAKWGKTLPEQMIIAFPPGGGIGDYTSQRAFEKYFSTNATQECDWKYEWDLPNDRLVMTAVSPLPTNVMYPGSTNYDWNVFPMGVTIGDEVASYDVLVSPHALVAGPSGSGKSVAQRNIVLHTIQHNNRWRFLGIDVKKTELTPWRKYKKTVLGIATTVEEAAEVLKYGFNDMMDRYSLMEEHGIQKVTEFENPPYNLLIMIDEGADLLSMSGSKTEEGKAEDALRQQCSDLIGRILRLGRAAGVHMVIAMQRPDATILRGEYKNNLEVRIAAGRMDSTPSSMVLDSAEAANLPGIKGRGILRYGAGMSVYQGYYAPVEWIDDFILQNPATDPPAVGIGGHLHDRYIEMYGPDAEYANYSFENPLPEDDKLHKDDTPSTITETSAEEVAQWITNDLKDFSEAAPSPALTPQAPPISPQPEQRTPFSLEEQHIPDTFTGQSGTGELPDYDFIDEDIDLSPATPPTPDSYKEKIDPWQHTPPARTEEGIFDFEVDELSEINSPLTSSTSSDSAQKAATPAPPPETREKDTREHNLFDFDTDEFSNFDEAGKF